MPVRRSIKQSERSVNDPDQMAATVARNLRATRAVQGLSLDALAARSGVSKGMLVELEQGRTNPSLGTLCRVANALGVAVPRLVEAGEELPVRVVRGAEMAALWHGARGGEGRLIVGTDLPIPTELWDWRLAKGESYTGQGHPPGAVEMLWVREGTLTLEFTDSAHEVAAGDAALFRADRPHKYVNRGRGATQFQMVVLEPSTPREAPPRTRRGASRG